MKDLLLALATCTLVCCNESTSETAKDTGTDSSIQSAAPPLPAGKIDIERFGPINIGQDVRALSSLIGEPSEKTEAQVWEADGLAHETWNYKAKGLSLGVVSGAEDEKSKSVFSITALPPCEYKTYAGMGIGSTEEDIRQAYARDIDSSLSSAGQIVVGSVYGGILFDITRGKATRVFLGAIAE